MILLNLKICSLNKGIPLMCLNFMSKNFVLSNLNPSWQVYTSYHHFNNLETWHLCMFVKFVILAYKFPLKKHSSLKFFFSLCMSIQLFHVYKFIMSINNLYRILTNVNNMLMVDFIMVSCCFMSHNMSSYTHGWINTN